eukprot:TRINITY_DN634_c2_g1_i2.p1 TRINITY_DN634_c2_g1~~TRINITY_DN634_c2_g1_i2.p1  ORF type:complete len:119 (-),score=44.63 TRINITY_DN634_c2_g1_i2:45-401(-)
MSMSDLYGLVDQSELDRGGSSGRRVNNNNNNNNESNGRVRRKTVIRWGNTEEDEEVYAPSDKELFEVWKNKFRIQKYRYTYYSWGDKIKSPEPFLPLLDLQIQQVTLGGKHFLALSGF